MTSQVTVETVLRHDWADWTRGYLHSLSQDEYERELLNRVLNYYPGARPAGPVDVEDDRGGNHIRIVESYEILDSWEPAADPRTLEAYFYTPEIAEVLADSPTRQRSMPLWLPYPLRIVCDTEVLLPDTADLEPWSCRIENAQLAFTAEARPHGQRLYLSYEYRTLADHVPAEDCARYFRELDRLQRSLQYSLTIGASRVRAPQQAASSR